MLVKTVVSRPTTVAIIFALLMGLGVFSLINLPVALFPDMDFPFLVVFTGYQGAGPEEVERSVTRPLEAALAGVSNLERIRSSSSSGFSMVLLEFTFGTDLVDASLSVRDSLELIRRFLPSAADTPIVLQFDMSMIPIMGLMVTGNRSAEEIREIAENSIVPRIEQTPGIATANISGGRERIIRVEIPQNRLEAYNLTVTEIQQMIAIQNIQANVGTITEGGLSFILTTVGEFASLDELRNTVISFRGGGLVGTSFEPPRRVFLRDVADVFEYFRNETNIVVVNGEPAVILNVQAQGGANAVQAANELRGRLDRILGEVPGDIGITELFNTTDIIENSLSQVSNTAVSGAVLAVVFLFIFLRSFKSTFIIGLSIPISVLITFMMMYFAGLTLNLMTMAGLVLGIGMLIDNSIVILENIYRYREKGAKLKPAAILGTAEMIKAITVSTLSTLCVFLPLIMFSGILGMAGELFAGLAFTIAISLGVSLFTAVFLVPVLASHYLPLVTRKQKPLHGPLAKIDGGFDKFFKGLDNGYRKLVDKILRKKAIVVISISIIFIGSIVMIPVVGWEFMPAVEDDNVVVTATLPVGTPLSYTEAVLRQFQVIVEREIVGFEDLIIQAGSGEGIAAIMGGGNNTGTLRLNLPPFAERTESATEIQDKLRPFFNQFPDVEFSFSSGGGGMGGGSPVEVIIRTEDTARGFVMANRIAELLAARIPYITEPQIDLTDGLPQIDLVIDRERMYALGLNTMVVGNELRAAVDGVTATRFRMGGNEYDVVLILAEADRNSRPALDSLFVNSQLVGGRVPLASFVSYREGTGPLTINRENQGRVIRVTAGTRPGARMNVVQEQVEYVIRTEIALEDGIIIDFGGDNAEMMEMMTNFILIVIVAILLVFGVMACLFESFRDPFIIIFTIPLSLIGIVGIYWMTGTLLNVLAAVGLLVLVGVITNNGIVLVDYTNLLRKRGMPLHEACVEAAGTRLRPILMTTLTTVVGLAPMAFWPGEGSELTAPIGKTVLGGLSFGTLMTLFLMPTIYYIVNRKSEERAAKMAAWRKKVASGDAWKKKSALGPATAAGIAITDAVGATLGNSEAE